MRYQNLYQFSLIFFAFLVTFGVGVFIYHEIFPEYKVYQYAYKDLEKFRASYTGVKPAPFTTGIKQILIPDENQGPEIIDRCISCHVAMNLPHFSPNRVARDVNDNVIIDNEGNPVLEPNPEYVWGKLDERIESLRHPVIINQLRSQGKDGEANERLAMAEELSWLKTEKVDGREVDLTKVISAHPLIGAETRPFEYHPMEEYGCTSCHSGNGRALVAKRAHGPVYDEEYEKAYHIPKPQFTEIDYENDPKFARMYNDKPGHDLIFQTTPILAGPLIAAKCVQCHQSASAEVQSAMDQFDFFIGQKQEQVEMIQQGIKNDQEAIAAFQNLSRLIEERGREGTIDWLNEKLGDYHLTSDQIDAYEGQLAYVQAHEEVATAIEVDVEKILARTPLMELSFEQQQEALKRFERAKKPMELVTQDKKLVNQMQTNVDKLTLNYTRGKELFISQACYACHRIAGFSRSSVGPELTKAGLSYPWFIKESIVWPQADLPSSTMPNFRLDHEELEDLMTFLMAQRGETKAISEVDYQISLRDWEAGEKMPWEKPISPTDIRNVREGMIVFASEGCAACHKLEGFESNVGFAVEKNADVTPTQMIDERDWFYSLFPEQILGSQLAKVVQENAKEIDARIVDGVRSGGIIEEIEERFPGLVEGFYTNFKFASRKSDDPDYQKRLHRILMVYIQEYGLGRDIAPHLNWSGIYRDDAWLLGHFHNPSAYTAKSIMPVMPFDDTKFYMLNHTLRVLAQKNREKLQEIWKVEGFSPPLAYQLLCSACHGEQRQGNGIISEWIYPIPKNLRNPVFLRSLTRERAIDSITHGVRGTPMPPWGETAIPTESPPVLNHSEIVQLVDWLYQGLPPQPRQESEEDYEKWQYFPEDVVLEMKKERDFLTPRPPKEEGEDLEELASDYFESRPSPIPGPDKELYYIREKYYTQQNLEEAQEFYEVNCATCHGKEGTGTGLRASTMVEAKPRMLTNLPWIRTRDDMRLLRSIKYGVSGTAMTPWGDQTTAAQRMQLVIFIRDLTRSQLLREDLEEVLYATFDEKIQKIEEERSKEYAVLEDAEQKLRDKKEKLFAFEENGGLYTEIVTLKKEVKKRRQLDDQYLEVIRLLEEERKIYRSLGEQMIATGVPPLFVEHYFKIITTGDDAYLELLIENLDKKIDDYQKKIDLQESKIRSPDRGKKIQELMNEQGKYINLRTKLVVQLANAKNLKSQQKEIYDHLR